jgi:annexin A7/11
VWKFNNSVKNIIHLGRRPPKIWDPRFQPIEPIGKSGTEGYYVPDEGYYVPDEGYYVPDEGYYVPDDGYYVPDEGYYVPDEGYYVPDEGYYVPDEGYSRNVVCALNCRTAFLFRKVDPPKKGLKIID